MTTGRMNRLLILILLGSMAAVSVISGCLSADLMKETGYMPGIYEGSGQGYRGSIYVEVQVSHAGIEDIVITFHEESAFPGEAAMEELLDLVLETGDTDLDAVSGATFSGVAVWAPADAGAGADLLRILSETDSSWPIPANIARSACAGASFTRSFTCGTRISHTPRGTGTTSVPCGGLVRWLLN